MAQNSQKVINTINVWGLKFNLMRIEDFIQLVESRIILNSTPIHITGVNPETVVHASNNIFLQKAINDSDLVNIDNNFIVLILRILGYRVPCRVATPDLFESLLRLANNNKFKIFILGSKQLILEKAIKNIEINYPFLKIHGHHGYFQHYEEESIIKKIKEFSPDMFFIAMPSPYKESFILKNKEEINAKVYLGVGGAIDIKGGLLKRAPKFLRKVGLEGIHRSVQNPFNYGKRVLKYYPRFLKIVIKSKIWKLKKK
jgi:N-acetylglucosaminyldiphosphoundecaprenol N-acetyl-beta-D-mannosaminyltransferase